MQRLLMKFPLVVILSSAVCFAGDYEDGTAAFDRGDYAIALKKLHPLAEQGNALAQNSLGVMYVEGKGVSQDSDEAIRWFRKAADQGLAEAQTNLGWMYVEGKSVSQDYAEAAKWFRNAADQGFAVAQYNLGGMYGRGEGVPRDFVLAFMWFSLAEKNGFQPASQLRESAEAFLTPSQIVEAQKRVSEWKNSERQPTP
jgi:uncharacterized protein